MALFGISVALFTRYSLSTSINYTDPNRSVPRAHRGKVSALSFAHGIVLQATLFCLLNGISAARDPGLMLATQSQSGTAQTPCTLEPLGGQFKLACTADLSVRLNPKGTPTQGTGVQNAKARPKPNAHKTDQTETNVQSSGEQAFLSYGNYADVAIGKPAGNSLTLSVPAFARRVVLVSGGRCHRATPAAGTCAPIALLVNIGSDTINNTHWIVALSWSGDDVQMANDMSSQEDFTLVINGKVATQQNVQDLLRPDPVGFHVELYKSSHACRKYVPNEEPETLDFGMNPASDQSLDNGIWVGSPKIFDSYRLRQMLSDAATQLAAINPWSAAAITGAYGNLQGVTSDVSYLAAQVTTLPTPTITTTSNLGTTASQTLTTPTVATTTTSTQCPQNYSPTLVAGTSSIICVPNAVAASGLVGTGVSQTTNGATNSSTTGATNSLQQQVTSGGVAGVLPTVQAPTPMTTPTNIGVSASDLLAEQVQLNAQLTILRLLLQGANSDQLILSHDRAVAQRGQTTLAFPITLAPQRRYKHSVAEVRVLILPRRQVGYFTPPKVSIVNLLPSEKTYNVAKVTSHQNSFGAGVAVEAVNIGAAGGKTKNRLYLAKDTDTVALQFPVGLPPDGSPHPSPAVPEEIRSGLEEASKWQEVGGCPALPNAASFLEGELSSSNTNAGVTDGTVSNLFDFQSSVMFGWQFRPVLGSSDVASNMRVVFAQLALPAGVQSDFEPAVFIQTSWREYDSKRQIVGPAFTSSCSWRRLNEAVAIVAPIKIKDLDVTDVGGGILRVRGAGQFFAAGVSVRSGATSTPIQQFDGQRIEYFANAKDILQNGDLTLVSESGTAIPFAIPWSDDKACRLYGPTLTAHPQPDGTSLVSLTFDREPDYDVQADGPQHPLVMIGTDVYGLKEKPFLDDSSCRKLPTGTHCTFSFAAPSDSLHGAHTFLVRDLAWDSRGSLGTIQFDPAFSGLAPMAKKDTTSAAPPGGAGAPPAPAAGGAPTPAASGVPAWFELTGSDLWQLHSFYVSGISACRDDGSCLYAYDDDGLPLPLNPRTFRVVSDTVAGIKLLPIATLHLAWQPSGGQKPVLWELKPKTDDSKPKLVADTPVLYVADSRLVTFSGIDLSKVTAVTFEGNTLVSKINKKDLQVVVTTLVTAKPGHKELQAVQPDPNDKTKTTTTQLALEVVVR